MSQAEKGTVYQTFDWVVFELFEELVAIYEYEDAARSEGLVAEVLLADPLHSTEQEPLSRVLRRKAGVTDQQGLVISGQTHELSLIEGPDKRVFGGQLRKEKEPAKGYPPLLQQAASLARTAGRVATKAVTTGRVLAPEEVVRRRWEICKACDSWREDEGRCGECGCYSKAKNTLAESSCPLDKWLAYKGEQDNGLDRPTST